MLYPAGSPLQTIDDYTSDARLVCSTFTYDFFLKLYDAKLFVSIPRSRADSFQFGRVEPIF